jgi:hypothetical protein
MRKKRNVRIQRGKANSGVWGGSDDRPPPIGYATRTACLAEEMPSTPKTYRCEMYCRL